MFDSDLQKDIENIEFVTSEDLFIMVAKKYPNLFENKQRKLIKRYNKHLKRYKKLFPKLGNIDKSHFSYDAKELLSKCKEIAQRNHSQTIGYEILKEVVLSDITNSVKTYIEMTFYEKLLIAVHESGHAVINFFLLTYFNLQISIVPMKNWLGSNFIVNCKGYSEKKDFEYLCMLYAGGIACEIILDDNGYYGCDNDLEKIGQLAYKMVLEKIDSPLKIDNPQKIEYEMNILLYMAKSVVKEIIDKHRKMVLNLALLLLEKEMLDSNQIIDFFKKETERERIEYGLNQFKNK